MMLIRQQDFTLFLAICLAGSGQHIGNIKLGPINPNHRTADISLFIGEQALWGQGYATEAATAMVRFGFEVAGLHRIVARVDERNASSARLLGRLGIRQEARLVHNEFFKGEWTTELDFAILADEWTARAT